MLMRTSDKEYVINLILSLIMGMCCFSIKVLEFLGWRAGGLEFWGLGFGTDTLQFVVENVIILQSCKLNVMCYQLC